MKKLVLLGGGGHCKSCIDVIEQNAEYEIIGILDQPEMQGMKVLNYSVIGTDADIEKYVNDDCCFLITIGQLQNADIRKKLALILYSYNAELATIVSPRAYISNYATIQEGTIVMHDVVINAAARVGKHCIINTKALIEHDAIIEDFCHISTGTVINGGVHIRKGSFMGSNSVTKEYVSTFENSFVKAGSLFRGKQ